ncbi:hypothetical protein SETIT_9G419200v2 [Setaria italica]|uniref:Uncharacterized protein n=1 Tax=Setaria italica TaxID=4555 RepID=A0A368SRL6_SETIT|nr:hypothetical protein SETIT_9G419200v2 [Setaria italica]
MTGGKDEEEYIACVDLSCLMILLFRDLVVLLLRGLVRAESGIRHGHVWTLARVYYWCCKSGLLGARYLLYKPIQSKSAWLMGEYGRTCNDATN